MLMFGRRLVLCLPVLLLILLIVTWPDPTRPSLEPERPGEDHPQPAGEAEVLEEKLESASIAREEHCVARGRILLPDGRPAAGAQVYLGTPHTALPPLRFAQSGRLPRPYETPAIPTSPAITDADGHYSVRTGPSAKDALFGYRVTATHEGMFAACSMDYEMPLPLAVPDLCLEEGFAVRGRVVDATGDPVTGVEAWIDISEGSSNYDLVAWSDDAGELEFHSIPRDDQLTSLELFLLHPDYPPTRLDLEPGDLPFQTVLLAGFTLRGTVTDPSGTPLVGVEVVPLAMDFFWPMRGLSRRAARTDEAGQFCLRGLPPKTVHLKVYADPDQRENSLKPWTILPAIAGPVEGSAGRVVTTGPIRIEAPGSVEGRIVGENGNPYPDREIHLETALSGPFWSCACRGTKTDSRGEFRFENVPPGSYHLVRLVNSVIRTNKYHHGDVTGVPGRTAILEVTYPGNP